MKKVLANIAVAGVCLFVGICTGRLAFVLLREGGIYGALGAILIWAILLVVAVIVRFC